MKAVLPNLGEELAVTLLAAEEADDEHAGAVDGEQGPDAVELGGEDLEDDEGEGELRQRRADVGPLERPLGSAHVDDLVLGQGDGAGSVHAQPIPVSGTTLGEVSNCPEQAYRRDAGRRGLLLTSNMVNEARPPSSRTGRGGSPTESSRSLVSDSGGKHELPKGPGYRQAQVRKTVFEQYQSSNPIATGIIRRSVCPPSAAPAK